MKVLWIDLETTSLHPEVADVLEFAALPEIDNVPLCEMVDAKVQALLHQDDKLYGHIDPSTFLGQHNEGCGGDPTCFLEPFSFDPADPPLFFYSPGVLTLGMPAGQLRDPSRWLTDEDRLPPEEALMRLVTLMDLNKHVSGRWVLAGHNIDYDGRVLFGWGRRVMGAERFDELIGSRINSFWSLDSVALARWFGYQGRLRTERNKYHLGAIAQALNIPLVDAHTAKADLTVTYQAVKTLLGD